MATRKIVPRADNEGGIGTALKRWASAFINALTADSATIGTLSGIVKAAAGVLSATALGAANLKFFMNAAGTAPEWTTGIKIGTFTIDTSIASGTQAITGVGFKPSNIIFMANIPGRPETSVGFDNGTSHYAIANRHSVAADTWSTNDTYSVYLMEASGVNYVGTVTSFDADGFTITWVKVGAKTGTATIIYVAFR